MPRGPDYQKERGERQQARILDALAGKQMTSLQIAAALHLSRATTLKHLTILRKRPNKRVYVRALILKSGIGRPEIIYACGSKNDATVRKVQETRILDVLEELTMPQSARQIADAAGLTHPNMKNYIRSLKGSRKIYVAKWAWSNQTRVPMYLAGDAEDAPKRPMREKVVITPAAPRSWFASLPGAQSIVQHREAA